MFKTVTKTWNPFKGCSHDCSYCWARDLALGRLKNSPRYSDGFRPRNVPEELMRRFKPGEFVFVSSMGDISFASREWASIILRRILKYPQTDFLLQSKNPGMFTEWGFDYPPNVYLGTTIETNRDYGLSKAPSPMERFFALGQTRGVRRFVSIEPIMDLDVDELTRWIRELRPAIVEVGADNHKKGLIEPSWEKVEELLSNLRQICPRVEEKDGLDRLKKGVTQEG